MSLLQISDQIFSIAETSFMAYVGLGQNGWRVGWNLEIIAAPKEVEGEEWEPKLYSHEFDLDLTPAFVAQIEADLPLGKENGETAFMLYVFEHEPIEQARLKIFRLQDGKFNFQLAGISAVFFNEQYADKLPIRVECNLSLAGVVVDEPNFTKAEERFSQFFDRSLFGQAKRHTNGGVIFNLNCGSASQETRT
ncbi:MAG: protein-disulfide reductase DsbD N-terminal domain-containing protein [Rhodanobacter sp.]|jgi:hypothetical protein|nr:protein-disulfide reductase DsbD N-terminal domain-containing protein [Rhodanobacter sp.]